MNDGGYLVFDLETIPDEALYGAPEQTEGQNRPFAPLYAQQVIAIGALWLDQRHGFRKLWIVEGEDEPRQLEELSRFIDHNRPLLVTFNGRGFDLPVLMLRSLHHGVPMPWYFAEERYRDRRNETGHIDLHDALALHGAVRRSVSLDIAARLVGLPGKLSVDGSQVEALYRQGELETIQRYCLADVAQTALLLLRYLLLQGALDRPAHDHAADGLLQALQRDGRLPELLAAVERPRLLPP